MTGLISQLLTELHVIERASNIRADHKVFGFRYQKTDQKLSIRNTNTTKTVDTANTEYEYSSHH